MALFRALDVGPVDYRARYFGRVASDMRGYEFYRVAVAHVPEPAVDALHAAQPRIAAGVASRRR
ncbi:MAG TPA: hypothetical protein VF515_15590 [Candidatus Binatia bacterium]